MDRSNGVVSEEHYRVNIVKQISFRERYCPQKELERFLSSEESLYLSILSKSVIRTLKFKTFELN